MMMEIVMEIILMNIYGDDWLLQLQLLLNNQCMRDAHIGQHGPTVQRLWIESNQLQGCLHGNIFLHSKNNRKYANNILSELKIS